MFYPSCMLQFLFSSGLKPGAELLLHVKLNVHMQEQLNLQIDNNSSVSFYFSLAEMFVCILKPQFQSD